MRTFKFLLLISFFVSLPFLAEASYRYAVHSGFNLQSDSLVFTMDNSVIAENINHAGEINDTIDLHNEKDFLESQKEQIEAEKYESSYDSLKQIVGQKKVTRLLFDYLITPPSRNDDNLLFTLQYYNRMEGKIISDIYVQSLEVFGPTFDDTLRTAKSWLEKNANLIHTKSNLNTIRKMLLFKVGDRIDPKVLYESERLIRSLPYIHDICFVFVDDSVNADFVKIEVLTKDRFSIGVSGNIDGINSAAFQVFNKNVFGVGQEISVGFVGHVRKEPYAGVEAFYKINNIKGKFIDLSAGYMNTFQNEGFIFDLEKPFISPLIPWGYGAAAKRFFRSFQITATDPVISDFSLDMAMFRIWGGRSFSINSAKQPFQLIITSSLAEFNYFNKPYDDNFIDRYYANRKLCFTGVIVAKQNYIQDYLVYGFGITEDIPKGFKHEIVYGFDINEFQNRHYLHLSLSHGNILPRHSGYLYMAAAFGGFFNRDLFDQGLISSNLNYISPINTIGKIRTRFFVKIGYIKGVNRQDVEFVDLNKNGYIRGFSSKLISGKQRLNANFEHVFFLNRDIYKFRVALYCFGDLGIVGSNRSSIFKEEYYSGLGVGVRIHNEYLVFKTLHLRVGFYPAAPSDMNFYRAVLDEQTRQKFYSFIPDEPQPLPFR